MIYNFRAKSIKSGTWFYGSLIEKSARWGSKYFIYVKSDDEEDPDFEEEVNFKTIGQFTGILDINGQEIYEGDIIENTTPFEEYCSPAVIGRSVYDEVGYSLFFKNQKLEDWQKKLLGGNFNGVELFQEYCLKHYGKYYKVIGNIHENIDLFK